MPKPIHHRSKTTPRCGTHGQGQNKKETPTETNTKVCKQMKATRKPTQTAIPICAATNKMAKYIKAKYKYQLCEEYHIPVDLPDSEAGAHWTYISSGVLVVSRWYAWDGPSGPVRDRRNVMRASLVHDALYQLIREGTIPDTCRNQADQIFRDLCIEDGVPRWLARIYYRGLRAFGKRATKPKRIYEI